MDQNEFIGAWGVKPRTNGEWCLDSNHSVLARIFLADITHQRRLSVEQDNILIVDESNKPFAIGYNDRTVFSAGYGVILDKNV
jgi:hypothetical protein